MSARTHIRPGFTLVEAIATMVILGVLGLVTSRLIFTASDVYLSSATRAQISSDASAALERIVAELRQVPVRASSSPAAPDLVAVTPESVEWRTGVASTSSVARSGTDLVWTESGTSAPLARNVVGFTVACFDESGAALASNLSGSGLDAVRTVELSITVSRAGQSESLRTRVFLRSMQQGATP